MDFIDSLRRKEYMWLIHSMISLVLNIATGWNARHAVLRSVSKGFFAEASTVSLLLFVDVICVCVWCIVSMRIIRIF